MALSALNVLSGISAAAAGLAGEKVSKTGTIPGIDLASLIPAFLGQKAGGAGGLLGSIASIASKTGLLNSTNLAKLAGSLFSSSQDVKVSKADTDAGGIAGLAAAIMGGSGKGTSLASIASMASNLAGEAKNKKEVNTMATDLGKTLSESFGLSFGGGSTALKALDTVVKNDDEGGLLKSILKGLM
jgi:hypothetical protein